MASKPQLIHRLFDIVDAEDWPLLVEVFAADVVYDRPGFPQMRGIAALQHFYRRTRTVTGTHVLYKLLADDDSGCCWGRFDGTNRAKDPVVEYFADWYDFGGDVIKYRRTFFYRPSV